MTAVGSNPTLFKFSLTADSSCVVYDMYTFLKVYPSMSVKGVSKLEYALLNVKSSFGNNHKGRDDVILKRDAFIEAAAKMLHDDGRLDDVSHFVSQKKRVRISDRNLFATDFYRYCDHLQDSLYKIKKLDSGRDFEFQFILVGVSISDICACINTWLDEH